MAPATWPSTVRRRVITWPGLNLATESMAVGRTANLVPPSAVMLVGAEGVGSQAS